MWRHFAHPWLLLLSAVLPLLGLLTWVALRQRRRALARLGSGLALRPLIDEVPWLRAGRRFCLSTGLMLLALGAAGPQWDRDLSQAVTPGRDLIVVLDQSRSMLAEAPSRLERARKALLGLVATMKQRAGHRIALVVFAGQPRVICPLTEDYDHVAQVLDQLNAEAPAPELGPGTRIGEALRLAVAIHLARQGLDTAIRGHQDILLLSDGDDPERDEEEWEGGLREAVEHRIPVYTVGVGDPDHDSPINLPTGPQKGPDGAVVLTRLYEKPLEEIARRTQASYTAAHTGVPALGDLFRRKIETRPLDEGSEDALPVYRQRYALFLGPALGLLALGLILPETLPRHPSLALRVSVGGTLTRRASEGRPRKENQR